MSDTRVSASGLSTAADTSLPDNLCYLINVTGEGLTTLNGVDDSCGPESGIGQLSPQSYRKGDTAELIVKIGTKRRFDLVGYSSDIGADGRPVCGGVLGVDVSTDSSGRKYAVLRIDGREITARPVIFATGTADINSGDNLITMQPVSLVASPLTTGFAFGAPYRRSDLPQGVAGCAAPPPTPATPRQTQRLVVTPSANLAAPVVSSKDPQVRLRMLTGAPIIHRSPSSSGGAHVGTGLFEIQKLRK